MLAELLDLVVPQDCAHCGSPGRALCHDCRGHLGGRAIRRDPEPVPEGLPPAFSACEYAGVAKSAILAHKERGVRSLAGPLGWALARAVFAASGGSRRLVLVPIPTTRASRAVRGDDTVAAIARRAARYLRTTGISADVEHALAQTRRRDDQAGLGRTARMANLAGAFEGRHLRGAGTVIIVDDVLTTGATAAEGARALTRSGIQPSAIATVAATMLRRVSVDTLSYP